MGLMRGIRKNIKGIYWVVVVMVVISFVFWGTRLGLSGGPKHAGIVFGKKVSTKEYLLQWQAARDRAIRYELMTGQQVNPEQIEAMAWQRVVQLREADRWGILIPMSDVKEYIRMTFSPEGQFDEEAYQSYLYRHGLTEERFAEMIRDNMRLSELERLVRETVVVPPGELRERYDYENEQKKIKLHMVESEPFVAAFDVSWEAEQYYLRHKDEFREPRKVSVQYAMLKTGSFAEKVSVTEEEVRKYYEENKSSFRGAGGKAAEFEDVKQHIENVLKSRKVDRMATEEAEKIFGFSDAAEMREVAERNNLDFGQTGLIPEEGPVEGGLGKEPEFRKAAFSTGMGELSPIIKTEDGYCVLTPVRVVGGRVLPFEEVRGIAAKKAREERLKQAARDAGLSPEETEAFLDENLMIRPDMDVSYEEARDEYERGLGRGEFLKAKRVRVQYIVIEKASFEKEVKISEREIKEEYKDKESKYKDEEGKVKPLEEVREEIEKALRSRKCEEMAKEQADEVLIIPRAQRMRQQAERCGLKLRTSGLFARGEMIDDYVGVSDSFADRAFETGVGEVSMPFSTEKGYCVVSPIQVVEERGADFEEVAAEAAEKAKLTKGENLARQICSELQKQVKEKMSAEKKDFETACKELGLKVEESDYFRRDDSEIEKVGRTEWATRMIFQSRPGEAQLPRTVPRGSFFYAVSEVRPASDEEFEKDREKYYERMAAIKGQEAFWEWSEAVMQEANVKVHYPVARRKGGK